MDSKRSTREIESGFCGMKAYEPYSFQAILIRPTVP